MKRNIIIYRDSKKQVEATRIESTVLTLTSTLDAWVQIKISRRGQVSFPFGINDEIGVDNIFVVKEKNPINGRYNKIAEYTFCFLD